MSREDNTLLQFGHSLRDTEVEGRASGEAPRATVCKVCGQHFGADGRFCPFDGEALAPAPDWDPTTDPLLFSVVDHRYEVQSVIGEGGMGTVYMVRHTALGKRFALKALRKELAQDGEIAARFIQEARTAASVSHPGLVEITDYGRLPTGQAYFVMELLSGSSLSTILRRGGRLPLARGVEYVRQIAEALKAAHDVGIVHRDLKPDNVHVGAGDGARDRLKIVDFGLARVIGSHRLTRKGVVFGTPHYMSPEQASGEPIDHRADIYALGIVMYEIFTGRVPFEADTYMGVLTKHMYMAPSPPSKAEGGSEELGALEDIILRCLEKKPDNRYAHLGELLDELRDVVATNPAGEIEIGAKRPKSSRPPRSLLAEREVLLSEDEIDGVPRRSSPALPAALVAMAFLSGILLIVLSRSCRSGSENQVAVPSSPPPPVPTPAGPTEPESARLAAASTEVQTLPSSAPVLAKSARKSVRPVPGHQPAPRTKPPPRIGGGDIIDPWAGR